MIMTTEEVSRGQFPGREVIGMSSCCTKHNIVAGNITSTTGSAWLALEKVRISKQSTAVGP
jgi:hypothetical protein